MQELLMATRKDSSIHHPALAIFRAALTTEQDPWTITSAARGIDHIAGPVEGRRAWLSLLNHSRAEVVARAALDATDAAYLPVMLELLERHPNQRVRNAVIRTLGRQKELVAFPAILKQLEILASRPDAIFALGDLGDLQAIPHLEKLLDDKTELWREDNHGGMLRVCDLAKDAIAKLSPKPN
jgi:HEAT repeat protein